MTEAQSSAENDRQHDPHGEFSIRNAIRQIQAGKDPNHEWFALIFQEYGPRCVQLLRALGLRRNLDDLTQEIMLRVYRGIPDFRFESSFDTWFTRIVKNAARNAFRDRNTKKVRAETSLDSILDPPHDGGAFSEPEARDPDPLQLTLGRERKSELDALLKNLPPRMRQAMLLYYIHGYDQAEIAKLQGSSVNTIKKQLVDGRKRIRPRLLEFARTLLGV